MKSIKILLISDGKPGHFKQSEGLVSLIENEKNISVTKIEMKLRVGIFYNLSKFLCKFEIFKMLFLFFYKIKNKVELEKEYDFVLASGRKLLPALCFFSSKGVKTIFIGKIKNNCFKESVNFNFNTDVNKSTYFEGGTIFTPLSLNGLSLENKFDRNGYLVFVLGGNSRTYKFQRVDYDFMIDFIKELSFKNFNIKVVTSRRTDESFELYLLESLQSLSNIQLFLYNQGNKKSLYSILDNARLAFVSADSSAMLNECVGSQIPTICIKPESSNPDFFESSLQKRFSDFGYIKKIDISELNEFEINEFENNYSPGFPVAGVVFSLKKIVFEKIFRSM